MIIAPLTRLVAAAALCLSFASAAGAQSANPFKKPAAAAQTAPAAPADAAKNAVEKKAPSEAQLASRARMKECGAEWQTMKKAGQTKGKTWREFSSECLKKK